MQLKRLLGAIAVTLLCSAPANAAVIFFDNFNGENGGVGALNYTGFANWTVTGGTVDLIGNGFFDFLPGNGLYVDLDGSTFNPGLMSANAIPLGPGSYIVDFLFAGSQRGTVEDAVFKVFGTSTTYINAGSGPVPSGLPFTMAGPFVFNLAAPDLIRFSFENSGRDNIGILIDNVRLQSVPEPGVLLLFATGLAGAYRRFRRA